MKVRIGLGWDVGGEEIDLDVSCILLDNKSAEVETIYFKNKESAEHGIRHLGDNLDGVGEGDDEQIEVRLSDILCCS